MSTISIYPIAGPPDDRFTPALVEAVGDLITYHGFPFIGGPDLERLRAALLNFIYGTPEATR